ncbi:sulfotransferase family protein [Nitzschia inconspicua]|uniref:Sulfotransferase family protein n=1 Tax=Nitzschia inconspicua TaxID=303405 RepID=A0A9K3PWQ9_9STRA|nr:sulfotransferase family protein [Nitzschia inconspicua]
MIVFTKPVLIAFVLGFVTLVIFHGKKNDNVRVISPSCDLFPLPYGNNFWDDAAGVSVKTHTEETHICGPRVLIVGAMKCGTNTIGHLLQKHPRIKINDCEKSGFDCNMTTFQGSKLGDLWEGNDYTIGRARHPDDWLKTWAERLPWTDGVSSISIDKSPSYFNTAKWPDIPRSINELLPNAKVIVTVCNPAERAFSLFHHYMDKNNTSSQLWRKRFVDNGFPNVQTFDDLTDILFFACQTSSNEDFCSTLRKEILQIGEYAIRLQPWYEAYGKENVLVVDMNEDNLQKTARILDLLGPSTLPPEEYPWEELDQEIEAATFKNLHYNGRSSAFHSYHASMTRLSQHYLLHNQELAQTLGENFPLDWNDEIKK